MRGPGLNLALTISGNPDHPEDSLRSIAAPQLRPLFDLADVTLHVVQTDLRAADAACLRAWPDIRLHGGELRDFTDTARLLAEMDLVVTVDTAMAHLAGALGLPVWLLLQHAADFRWLRGRADTPWYPTMRLFRQGPERRWEPVLQDVARALKMGCLAAAAAGVDPATTA